MGLRRKRTRLRLLVVAAALAGCFAASLSGTLAAFAYARPVARDALAETRQAQAGREVVTIGMMMAEHPPV